MFLRRSYSFLSLAVVALLAAPLFGQIQIAEELVVDLDAEDASAGTATWTNTAGSVAEDNFGIIGDPTSEFIDGHAAVTFDGNDAYQMVDEAPPTLVGTPPENSRSIEVWVYNPTINGEENMVAWGHRGDPCGSSMGFNFAGLAVTHWCHDLGWNPVPTAAQWTHLAYSYDGTTLSIYENGLLNNNRDFSPGQINTFEPSHITIAAQLENDGMALAAENFRGKLSIARVRVHGGALTGVQVLNNFNEEMGDFNIPTSAPSYLTVPVDTAIERNTVVTYSQEIIIAGWPVGTLEVVEPAEATLVEIFPRRYRIEYPVPDPNPNSVDFTVRATNSVGMTEASWTLTIVGLDPNDPIQLAGTLFVDLDAEDFVDGNVWPNTGTLGDFDIIHGNPLLNSFGGTPGVAFEGGSAIQGPFAPEGLAGSSGRTIEVWAYNPSDLAPEETMVSWGRRGAPPFSNESFLYDGAALVHWDHDLGWGSIPAYGQWHHLVYTHDDETGLSKVYSDGVFVNQRGPDTLVTHASRITLGAQTCGPFGDEHIHDGCQIDDIEGESLAHPNHMYSGLIGKVRIHDGVLLDFQIAHNHDKERPSFATVFVDADIPNAPPEDTIFVGTPTYNAFLEIIGEPAPLVEVLSPGGASVAVDGTLTYPIPDPDSPGSFDVSIRVSNVDIDQNPIEKTVSWTVAVREAPNTGAPLETAGEVFVNVDASDATAGSASWANTGTLGDLVEVGNAVKVEDFLGAPAVALNLDVAGDAYTTSENAPAGLVGVRPTRTIEVWALNPSIDGQEGMVTWGKRSSPDGSTLSFNYASFAVTHWGGCCDVPWGTALPHPPTNQWHHLVYAHDGVVSRVYVDGQEVVAKDTMGRINTDLATKIVLGTQINQDGVTLEFPGIGEAGVFHFSGYLSRVRVHDGVLRAEQVAHNYNEERENFAPGPPQFRNPPTDHMAFNDRTYQREVVILTQVTANAALVGRTPAGSTLEVQSSAGGGAAGIDNVNVQPGENVVVVVPIPDPAPASFAVDLVVDSTAGQVNASWVVTLVPAPTRPPTNQIEVAEELIVSLDAIHPTAGTGEWANFGTLEDFTKIGNPFVSFHNGFAGVAFNTFLAEDAYQSQDDAPAGLVGTDPTRSIECWVFNAEIGGEEAMVAWGGRHEPTRGSNMSFNFGTRTDAGAVTHFHAPDMSWGNETPSAGEWHHLVYTLDGTTGRVYSDGVLFNTKEVAGQIATVSPSKINLGAQNQGDGLAPVFDSNLVGTLSLAIVRVHDGVLDVNQIQSNFDTEKAQFGKGPPVGPIFRRGDHDGSGLVDITDPLNLLSFLFLGTTPPICEDASDGDNSGALDISDALNVLGFLFLGSFPLNDTPPGPTNCGPDPVVVVDPDGPDGFPEQPVTSLGCNTYPSATGTACP
jgi:hypothetical protein